jgi:SAM-dependent methyltransferase
VNTGCAAVYPIVDGIPILIDDKKSVFSVEDFVSRRNTTFHVTKSRLERLMHKADQLIPDIGVPIGSEAHFSRFRELLRNRSGNKPKVLVVGGSILGQGMAALAKDPDVELVGTDVSFGPLTELICDAHDIPFKDEMFDGVIAQAVLEHVVDPSRCVAEIYRVLKPGALVYAETPFIQQVHMGRYDFTRFTHSGHRRLFRRFTEVASGAICGPGMALAWSYQYFLLSFAESRAVRAMLSAFARMTSFFLKYTDYYLIHKASSIDGASGVYFIGRKATTILSDRDVIAYYKGFNSR